jgi:hypothetical protein
MFTVLWHLKGKKENGYTFFSDHSQDPVTRHSLCSCCLFLSGVGQMKWLQDKIHPAAAAGV